MSYEELESALIKEKDLHSLTRNRFQEADKHIDKLRAGLKERDILLDKMNEEMISLRKELQERDSRTCGNCKLYDSTGKCMLSKQDGDSWTFINVEPDFGCNKWVARDMRMEDEHDRLSSDTDTTVDNSVDSDNIVSKMTIPIIEVDEETDREIDEYLNKQDGYRESKLDLDTFTAHGFEVPSFDGEIWKEVDNEVGTRILGRVYDEPTYWYKDGTCGNDNRDYNLTPIKKHWYDDPTNFPALLVWDSGIDTPSYRSTISKDSFIKLHRQGWKLATKEEVNSLYCEG